MTYEFNKALCEERHRVINEEIDNVDKRVKIIENRFLAIMTALVLTLVGVVANLLIQIAR